MITKGTTGSGEHVCGDDGADNIHRIFLLAVALGNISYMYEEEQVWQSFCSQQCDTLEDDVGY